MKTRTYLPGAVIASGLLLAACGGGSGSSSSGGGSAVPDPPFEVTSAGPQCYGNVSVTKGGGSSAFPDEPDGEFHPEIVICQWNCTTYQNQRTYLMVQFSSVADGSWGIDHPIITSTNPSCK